MSLLVSVFAGVHLSVFVSLCVSGHVIVVPVFAISFHSACPDGAHVGVRIIVSINMCMCMFALHFL